MSCIASPRERTVWLWQTATMTCIRIFPMWHIGPACVLSGCKNKDFKKMKSPPAVCYNDIQMEHGTCVSNKKLESRGRRNMDKKKISWRVVMYLLLAAGFGVLLALLLVVNNQAYTQAEETARRENLQSLQNALQENDLYLKTAQGHLRELLRTVDDQRKNLEKEGTIAQVMAKTTCLNAMNNKISSGFGISFLFLYQEGGAVYLMTSSADQEIAEKLALREQIFAEQIPVVALSESRWSLLSVGETHIFLWPISWVIWLWDAFWMFHSGLNRRKIHIFFFKKMFLSMG